MKHAIILGASVATVLMASPLRAEEGSSQPLTRADCEKAGQPWDDSVNVCGLNLESSSSASEALPMAASDNSGQPLTRDACGQAGMDWNDRANVCESESDELNIGVVKPHTPGVSQPLSRSACDEAGLEWNDSANVCGASAATAQTASEVKAAETSGQPLTRDDCSKAGMKWNDSTNVCGETSEGSKVQAAPLSPKQQSAKKVEVERSKVKAAKKVERAKPKAAPKAAKAKSSKKQAYTKTGSAYRRKAQAQPAPPVQRRPFRLFRNPDRPVTVQ